jgi:preprotein translocase subunit SecA
MEAAEPGLSSKAERFFVLVQTDNLWKEHLQAIKFLQQAVRWAAGVALTDAALCEERRAVVWQGWVGSGSSW